MQNDELEHRTKLTELEKIRSDIRKELAQEYHWDRQQKHWKWIIILGIIAVLINGLKSLWS